MPLRASCNYLSLIKSLLLNKQVFYQTIAVINTQLSEMQFDRYFINK